MPCGTVASRVQPMKPTALAKLPFLVMSCGGTPRTTVPFHLYSSSNGIHLRSPSSSVRTMSDNLYCEPCSRFLRGELRLLRTREWAMKWAVAFEHHTDFESFENAMRLPCALCSLAHHHSDDTLDALDWTPLEVCYRYDHINNTRNMWFRNAVYLSASLVIVPCSCEYRI